MQCYFIFRNLMRKPWIQALNTSATPKDFARALTVLQCCIKPCLMVNVWYESLGHTMLKKISQAMKDDKKKSEKRERYVYFLFLRIHSILSRRLVSSHIELETDFIFLWSRLYDSNYMLTGPIKIWNGQIISGLKIAFKTGACAKLRVIIHEFVTIPFIQPFWS